MILRDDTMRRTGEEQRFHLAFENNVAGMVITDTEDRVLSVNDSFCKMLGMNREEFLGKTSTAITFDEDLEITRTMNSRLIAGETTQLVYSKRYVHHNGNIVWAEVSRSLARDESGKPQYVVVSVRDITEERKLLSQLSHQELHDPLTGLANRTLFEHNLSVAFTKAGRNQAWTGAIFIDPDDFKEKNDTFAHLVGDRLLVEVAQRLAGATRASDTLCRLGGDEFIYLAEGLTNPSEAESLARRWQSSTNLFPSNLVGSSRQRLLASRLRSAKIAMSISSETPTLRYIRQSLEARIAVPALSQRCTNRFPIVWS